jgi:alpha-mannosidase
MIGNAHLDPAWLWSWREGFSETRATFASALARMEEYPEYIFTASSAVLYEWIERVNPALFEKIREKVKQGRWCIVGGWQTESDCNIPCGESFIRNALYSQRYFIHRFGVMCTTGYCIDSFGHAGTLPQLLKLSGMNAYVFMRPGPHENPELPEGAFIWRGTDGTEILAFHIFRNYGVAFAETLQQQLKLIEEKSRVPAMCFYGVGNHGGGPTKELLAYIEKLRGGGAPLIYSSPDRYFQEIKNYANDLPVWNGEMQWHAVGCYSAHSGIKNANRRTEWLLITAERMASLASAFLGTPYPNSRIESAWKDLLFCQFHDILAGTCEKNVCDDAIEQIGRASRTAKEIITESVQRLSAVINTQGEGECIIMFNPHAFPVSGCMETDDIFVRHRTTEDIEIRDESNRKILFQRIQSATQAGCSRAVVFAELPPLGFQIFRLLSRKKNEQPSTEDSKLPADGSLLIATENLLENNFLKLSINPDGFISLFDKTLLKEIFSAPAGVPVVIHDYSDTWSHRINSYNEIAGTFKLVSKTLVENGPLRARLRMRYVFRSSFLHLDYILERFSRVIRCTGKLDWREHHCVLKISYPVAVSTPCWTSEAPYGEVSRKPDGIERPIQQWTDISDEWGGLAIINDNKYSADANGNVLRITIVRSPVYAHHEPCQPAEDSWYMDQGIQTFTLLLVPHGNEWREFVTHQSHLLNCPPIVHREWCHKGKIKKLSDFVRIDGKGIIVMVIKQPENGEDGWVLRAFNCEDHPVEASFEIPYLKRKWKASFRKWEVKTFVISEDSSRPVAEVNGIENPD